MDKRDRYDSLFKYYGGLYGVDWRLLKAQVRAESDFDPNVVSRRGASGLAQFMARTWEEWKDGTPGIQNSDFGWDPTNPEHAIKAQAAYMAWLIKQVRGDYKLALAAYNYGIGNIKDKGYDGWPQETKDYVPKVMNEYAKG